MSSYYILKEKEPFGPETFKRCTIGRHNGFSVGSHIVRKQDKRKWVILTKSIFNDDQQIDIELLPMLCPLLRCDGPLYVIDILGYQYAVKYSHLLFLNDPMVLSNRTIRKIIRAAGAFVKVENNKGRQSNLIRCKKLIASANSDLGNPICSSTKEQLEKALALINEYPSRKDYRELPYYFFKCLGKAITSLLDL